VRTILLPGQGRFLLQFLQHPDEEDEGRGLERVVNGRKPPGPGVLEHPDQPLPEGLLLDPERPRRPLPPDPPVGGPLQG